MERDLFCLLLSGNYQCLKPQALKFTKSAEDAQDLIQETILRAIKHSDKFMEGTNLRGWLYVIMRNLFINRHRRLNMSMLSLDEEASMVDNYTVTQNTAESDLAVKEIKAVVNRLPPQYALPLEMHLEGYKYAEIMKVLDTPMGTVKNRIHVARRQVAAKISGL